MLPKGLVRFLLALALFFVALDLSGVFALAQTAVCAQDCPDDDEAGQCDPACQDCTCCSHVRPMIAAEPPPATISQPLQEHHTIFLARAAEGEPREIAHVPISLLG